MAWWVRIHLPMQQTQVRSLVQEGSRAAGQVSPCAAITEPVLQGPRAATTEAHVPRARALR